MFVLFEFYCLVSYPPSPTDFASYIMRDSENRSGAQMPVSLEY